MAGATDLEATISRRRPRWIIVIVVALLTTIAAASVNAIYHANSTGRAGRGRVQSSENLNRIGAAKENLNRIGTAIHAFHEANERLPGYLRAGDGTPLLSWRVALLPHLGERALYDEFRLDEPWDGPHNRTLLGRMPAIFALPGARADPGMTFYRSFSGPGTLFDPVDKAAPSFAEITNGLSNTVAVVEASEAVPWTRPDSEIPVEGVGLRRRVGGHFPGGANVLLLDGSARFLKDSAGTGSLLRVLTRRSDGGDLDLTLDEDGKTFLAPIATAGQLVLYEGLPHQVDDRAAFEAERSAKPTVTLHDFAFYRDPVAVSAGDKEALRRLLGDGGSFRAWRGQKLCGDFHPDYLAEWHAGGATYQVLICFGCGEAKVFGPGESLRLDITEEADRKLSKILLKYRKNRPQRVGS